MTRSFRVASVIRLTKLRLLGDVSTVARWEGGGTGRRGGGGAGAAAGGGAGGGGPGGGGADGGIRMGRVARSSGVWAAAIFWVAGSGAGLGAGVTAIFWVGGSTGIFWVVGSTRMRWVAGSGAAWRRTAPAAGGAGRSGSSPAVNWNISRGPCWGSPRVIDWPSWMSTVEVRAPSVNRPLSLRSMATQ
ncbi:hypothetical protein A5657_22930 [Mycobacterium kubicae]|nr:hypothetical protein A5657_22930 [Mycobacterium kubicae]